MSESNAIEVPTDHAMMSATEIAARMSPADNPTLISADYVRDRMRRLVWPSTKVGRHRLMTDAQFWEAIEIQSDAAVGVRSGLSPRSRHRRAS